MKVFYNCLLLTLLMVCSSVTFSSALDQQRTDFLQAEKFIAQRRDAEFLKLSSTLVDYPLYPYLQYQWLQNNLANTDKVVNFLNQYKDSQYALLLKDQWLAYLARGQRWTEFIQHYSPSDSMALGCQFNWALHQTGQTQAALNAAKQLWVSKKDLSSACDPLMSAFTASPLLTPDLIWQRFEFALENDNVSLAIYTQRFFNEKEKIQAAQWLQVHKNPTLITHQSFLTSDQGKLFAYGVSRLAKSELDLAIAVWDGRKASFPLDSQISLTIERKLALALAKKRDNRAFDRLNSIAIADAETTEWKIRAALLKQNWQQVSVALAELSAEEKQQPTWQYWQARALLEKGDVLQAYILFNQLAKDRSFYGFLAADFAGKPYYTQNHPVILKTNALETLAATTDFKIIEEFNFHQRETEATQHWWYAVKKLDKQQQQIAAKLAQSWQWDKIAIMTLVKSDYWDDLTLRFPVRFQSEVDAHAANQALNPAMVFGLIRQESMLDKRAASSAGALGLMQLMPKTANEIANNLHEPWQGKNSLFTPTTNIKYGSYYYKQMLNRFNQHFALATAAYNAGPNRVNKWLPSEHQMPADVWIETIPFKETRKYVTSVLTYAILYQQQIGSHALKLQELLQDITPTQK